MHQTPKGHVLHRSECVAFTIVAKANSYMAKANSYTAKANSYTAKANSYTAKPNSYTATKRPKLTRTQPKLTRTQPKLTRTRPELKLIIPASCRGCLRRFDFFANTHDILTEMFASGGSHVVLVPRLLHPWGCRCASVKDLSPSPSVALGSSIKGTHCR